MKFCDNRTEVEIINKIADRFIGIAKEQGIRLDKMGIVMDVEAAHCNGNPIDLVDLLAASKGDFVHDLDGIRRHIDRTTGQLGDCFSPRYSRRASVKVG